MELIVGVFVVLGFLAILIRLFPRDPAGRAMLPRIVDDSIGMWTLRRLTGRRLWERPWEDGPDLPSEATAVSPPPAVAPPPAVPPPAEALPAASASAVAPPSAPLGAAPTQSQPSNPLDRRPALPLTAYAATPARLAAAGVVRVSMAQPRPGLITSIGRRVRAAFVMKEAARRATRPAPGAGLEAPLPIARSGVSTSRILAESPTDRSPRRQADVTAAARSRSSGAARARPTLGQLATVLTFGVIGLVAGAAASSPATEQDRLTDASVQPVATHSSGPSSSVRPPPSSATP